MIAKAFCAVLLMANVAVADDFCQVKLGAGSPEFTALLGDWAGTVRTGIAVGADGKPQGMSPDDAETLEIKLAAEGAGLAMEEAFEFFPKVALKPVGAQDKAPDFALPGESPLPAAELLAPEAQGVDLSCDAGTLPQFAADMALDDAGKATFRLYVLASDELALVITGAGAEGKARAVIDLSRAAAN